MTAKLRRCLLPLLFASVLLMCFAPSINAQSMCFPVSSNPMVMESLCSSAPPAHVENAASSARLDALAVESRLTLTAEQVSDMVVDDPPMIRRGDVIVYEANRRDFVFEILLSDGRTIVTQPLTHEDAEDSSVSWRKGHTRLDYPEAVGQRIVGYKLKPLHAIGTALAFRGIKIYREGRMMLELEKSGPEPKPVEPPMSYPPDPQVKLASATAPGPFPERAGTGFAPLLRMPVGIAAQPIVVQAPTDPADPDNFKFTGAELDPESGLYLMGARYYSPGIGRFTSPDPEQTAGFEHMEDPQSWNAYAYARNNPLRYLDPDGLNYTVCQTGGKNCADLSDDQFNQFLKDNPNIRLSASGTISIVNPDGSQTKLGSEQYYNEKDQQAAGMIGIGGQRFIAAFAKQAVLAGVTGGASSAFTGGLLEGLGLANASTSVLGLGGAADAANAYSTLSATSIKHIAAHLDEFKALDPSMTVADQAKIGYDVIKTGTKVGPRVYEGTATIGGQAVKVRAVVGGAGQLRSVYIPH